MFFISFWFLPTNKIIANNVENTNIFRLDDITNGNLKVKGLENSIKVVNENAVSAENANKLESDEHNLNLNNERIDKSSMSSEILSNLKYKNYDCDKCCLGKQTRESYNLIDRDGRLKSSLNTVIFNMCLDCATDKIFSNNPDLFKRHENGVSCNINKILELLSDCCPSCYEHIRKAIILAYCNCPYQFDKKYDIFKTTFESNEKNDSYENFLYSLQSRTIQDYLDQKKDYETISKEIQNMNDEIKTIKSFKK